MIIVSLLVAVARPFLHARRFLHPLLLMGLRRDVAALIPRLVVFETIIVL